LPRTLVDSGIGFVTYSLDPAIGKLAVVLIRGYQRYLSPFKGYSCAHRVKHGGESCSEYARKVFTDVGWRVGLVRLKARFHACSAASRALRADRRHNKVSEDRLEPTDGDGVDPPGIDSSSRTLGHRVRDRGAECCQWGAGDVCASFLGDFCIPPSI
jgi:putative component of membrane protein insertase Oxa1/YidC/SpoIIIJ protein YidD